jgi:hypothetical protein
MLYIVIVIVLLLLIAYMASLSNIIIMFDNSAFNFEVSIISINIIAINP